MTHKYVMRSFTLSPLQTIALVLAKFKENLPAFLKRTGFEEKYETVEEHADSIEITFSEKGTGQQFGIVIAKNPGSDDIHLTAGFPYDNTADQYYHETFGTFFNSL